MTVEQHTAAIVADIAYKRADRTVARDIQAAGRSVQQQVLGAMEQGAGKRDL